MNEEQLRRWEGRVQRLPEPDGCWLWTGCRIPKGYGVFYVGGGRAYAHRIGYEHFVGPINEETLDHLCRNRACVNPAHLEPVSHRENILRGESPAAKNAVKTHCAGGHVFGEANTYHWGGQRHCRICRREAKRRERARAIA